VLCDGPTVAGHARAWAAHQTISDPDHVAAAKVLRRSRIHRCFGKDCLFKRDDRVHLGSEAMR
jgi:hypothetical protein